MAIELKKVQNIETLALGFNYEAVVDLTTDLGSTAGSATAVDIQVGGAAMAGGLPIARTWPSLSAECEVRKSNRGFEL